MYRAAAGLIATSSLSIPPPPVHRLVDMKAALAAMCAHEVPPVPVAGGTDLCAAFNEGLLPSALVALDRIGDLRTITVNAGTLRIGALVTHGVGAVHPLVTGLLPGFAAAWTRIATMRIRFWGTIGGNLMARRTRYEMSLLLQALGATLHFMLPDGAMQAMAPADFWTEDPPPRGLLY